MKLALAKNVATLMAMKGLAIAGLVCLSVIGQAQGESREELFAWFDTLGFNERLQGLAVRLDSWETNQKGRFRSGLSYGFELPSASGKRWYARIDLHQFPLDPGRDSDHYSETLTTVDFAAAARSELTRQAENEGRVFEEYGPNREMNFDRRPAWSWPSEPFTWARIAALRGHEELSKELFDVAMKLAKKNRTDLPSALKDTFGNYAAYELVRAIAGRKDGYGDVRKRAVAFGKLFPDHRDAAMAKDLIETVDAMVVSDREWAARAKKSGQEGEIEELIHQLQEATPKSTFSRNVVSVLGMFERQKGDFPASKLLLIGYPAIPALSASLGDRRLTRIARPSEIYRVGDAAREILYAIIPETNPRAADGDRRWAEEWHARLLGKGERRMLIEAVTRADGSEGRCFDLIVKKYPDDAVPTARIALGKMPEGSRREWLVSSMQGHQIPGAKELAWELLEGDRQAAVRIAAAQYLAESEPDRVLRAILKELGRGEYDRDLFMLVVKLGGAKGVEAAAQAIKKRPVGERMDFVLDLRGREPSKALEKFLVECLGDVEQNKPMSYSTSGGGVSYDFRDSRICDIAAFVLGSIWPEKYKFEMLETEPKMDRLRAEFIRIWQSGQG